MGSLFGGQHLAGLDPSTQRGLISDSARAAGLQLLMQAQNPNLTEALGSAVAAGRETAVGGADYARQVSRQEALDQQRQEQLELQRESTEALIDQRRQKAELERRQATQKVNALKRNEVGVQQLRQELVQAGFKEAAMWNKEQVESTHKELIERRFEKMFPDPVKPTKGPNLQYKTIGGVPHSFDPASGSLSAIPGAPVEPPKADKAVEEDVAAVLSTAEAMGVADQIPGLAEDVRSKLSAISDPTLRGIERDRILAAISAYQRQQMGLE